MEQFTQQLKELLQNILGEDYDIRKQEVTKVNDTKLTALVLTEKGSNIGATIYLDEYYKYYECGQLQTIADNIISNLQTQEKTVIPEDIVSDYKNFDSVRDRIFFKLINKDLNKEYLTDKCYMEYLDMAIVFYIMVELNEDHIASTSVHPTMLQHWSVTENDLFDIAKANMKSSMPSKIVSLEKLILDMIGIPYDDEFSKMMNPPETPYVLYVLSNDRGINGASAFLYNDVLKDFAIDKGVEQVLILPASIHETLLVPIKDDEDVDIDFFRGMVKDANESAVGRGDLLSNNVYIYDLNKETVEIFG